MTFTTAELILLILIVSIILIIFVILTISEIKDYLNSKKRLLLTGDDEKHEKVIEKPVVKKTIVKKEPIVIMDKKDKVREAVKKENVILEEEDVVISKPAKSAIIIEEEEEYYDPFFDEEEVVMDAPKKVKEEVKKEIKPEVHEIKDELTINDVLTEDDVKEDYKKVKDVVELVENKDKINNYEDTITNFELEQEENAIISLDELSKISDRMYEENEPIQYDDSDVPITIDEIMSKFNSVDKPKEEPITITTKDVVNKNDDDSYFMEEDEEEDFLTDLSRAHRRMTSR